MPITPLHFGPGLLFRSFSRHISLAAFIVANCIIDIEPIVTFLFTGDPMHRFMHTYIGATLAAAATAVFAKRPSEQWLRYWNTKLSPIQAKWLGCRETISYPAFWIGALSGAWSHIWLDSIMHIDVEPWWPFESGNPSHGLIDLDHLHALCVVAGFFGLLLLAWKSWVTTSPLFPALRKWTGRIVGAAFLYYIGYFYYSLGTGKERMTEICSQMSPGMSVEQLVLLARKYDLGPSMPRPDAKVSYLAEVRSFGRHACRVELENGVVKSATYNFAD